MLKKYLYFTILISSIILWTGCSEDESSTGSGGGGTGGANESCLDAEDVEGTWMLASSSSSASITTNTNVSVLDGWTEVSNPMALSIVLDDVALSADFHYLHASSNDNEIEFFLSENSFWSGWGDMFIEIECDIDDLTSCSSFLSYTDATNTINVALDSLTSVGWNFTDNTYSLVIDEFTEESTYTNATFSVVSEATISTGTMSILANTPLIIETITNTQEAWNQSYITFNSDNTVTHLNTLDCSLISPTNDYDCYNEGCMPTMADDMLSGCQNIDCTTLTLAEECLMWNACVWADDTCVAYESNETLPSQWDLDCNELILTTTLPGTETSYNVAYDLSLSDDQMSYSLSQDFCTQYAYYGYECDAYSGPAEDFYGLTGDQIDNIVITSSFHYSSSSLPGMRTNTMRVVDNPINRPQILRSLRK
tara:strand:+ start:460 stop:1731 length:1272 start_codon:yes stop_codon:yes gene_type:complete